MGSVNISSMGMNFRTGAASFSSVLFFILFGLQVLEVIDWPWWVIFLPLAVAPLLWVLKWVIIIWGLLWLATRLRG